MTPTVTDCAETVLGAVTQYACWYRLAFYFPSPSPPPRTVFPRFHFSLAYSFLSLVNTSFMTSLFNKTTPHAADKLPDDVPVVGVPSPVGSC